MTKKTFVGGAAILGISGLICKLIGAVYRIPLASILGTNGMAYYQIAYPIYTALLVIASAGLPAAISKIVSEHCARGDYRNAHRTFQVSFKLLLVLGTVLTVLLMALAQPIASVMGIPAAYPSILAIAPALFLVALISAYRGYFQGLQLMTPTAVSQLTEQIIKLVVGFSLASMWAKENPLMGAVGALIGVSVSEAVALVLLIALYNRSKKQIKTQIRTGARLQLQPKKTVLRTLIAVALPITIGSCIMPLVQLIDNAMVVNILRDVVGFTQDHAETQFGLLTGYVTPIINMPAVLSLSLQISIIPAIAACVASRNQMQMQRYVSGGLKIAVLIGMPCAVGLFLLGGPIIALLYKGVAADAADFATAASLMRTMALGLFFLTIIQTCSGILQGIGKVFVPVRNLAIGAVLKIVTSFILLRMPEVNVQGAALGTVICYGTAAVLDLIYIIRHTQLRLSVGDFLLRPALAAAGMGVVTYFTYEMLSARSNTIATLAAIVLAVIVYVILILVFRAVKPEDVALLPGSGKIEYFLRRIGIWR